MARRPASPCGLGEGGSYYIDTSVEVAGKESLDALYLAWHTPYINSTKRMFSFHLVSSMESSSHSSAGKSV